MLMPIRKKKNLHQIGEQSEWRSESSIHVEQTLLKNPWQNLQQLMQLFPCGIYSADLQRVNLLLSAHSDFLKITDNMQCNSIEAIGVDLQMQISSPTEGENLFLGLRKEKQ